MTRMSKGKAAVNKADISKRKTEPYRKGDRLQNDYGQSQPL